MEEGAVRPAGWSHGLWYPVPLTQSQLCGHSALTHETGSHRDAVSRDPQAPDTHGEPAVGHRHTKTNFLIFLQLPEIANDYSATPLHPPTPRCACNVPRASWLLQAAGQRGAREEEGREPLDKSPC